MAYDTEDNASEAKTGSAILLGSKVECSLSLRWARPSKSSLGLSTSRSYGPGGGRCEQGGAYRCAPQHRRE